MAHRIINPLISGYFTASLDIYSIPEFIRNYNQNLGGYPMYTRFHPPGAILFFNLNTANFLTNKLNLKHNEFIFLLTIQAVQVLIFQTVLVTVW